MYLNIYIKTNPKGESQKKYYPRNQILCIMCVSWAYSIFIRDNDVAHREHITYMYRILWILFIHMWADWTPQSLWKSIFFISQMNMDWFCLCVIDMRDNVTQNVCTMSQVQQRCIPRVWNYRQSAVRCCIMNYANFPFPNTAPSRFDHSNNRRHLVLCLTTSRSPLSLCLKLDCDSDELEECWQQIGWRI